MRVLPGIKRDGTVFEGAYFTNGKWVRMQRGVPRSIFGYAQSATGFRGPSRGVAQYPINGTIIFHSGSQYGIDQATLSYTGTTAGVVHRGPAGYVQNTDTLWQFDEAWNAGANNTALLASGPPNLTFMDNSVATPLYYGDITTTNGLIDTGAPNVSGGVLVLHPYVLVFGSFGFVAWSDANEPTVWGTGDAGDARVTQLKIVVGKPVRGGAGFSPAGLLWSLSSLLRVSFVGQPAIFSFDTISDEISILSSSSIVEYDGIFYWPGVDRFLVYNGIVREVPNSLNLNWFYDENTGINRQYAQKCWGVKVPRFGEIWWFYPRGDATECNDAIIFNVRENTWYDAGMAPGAARSAGVGPLITPYPLWMENVQGQDGTFSLWRHETGTDEVSGLATNAIESFIDTGDISWCGQGPAQQWAGIDRNVRLTRFEPDFNQSGPMTLTVKGRAYAHGTTDVGDNYAFDQNTTKIDISARSQRRQMRLRMGSNDVGVGWQCGQPLMHTGFGDQRPTPITPTDPQADAQ
jgi:hypothetical protein